MQTAATEETGGAEPATESANALERWLVDVCLARSNAERTARDLHSRHERAVRLMSGAREDLRLGHVSAAQSTLVLIEQILAGVA